MDVRDLCMGCMSKKGVAEVCPYCGWQEGSEKESPQYLSPGIVLNERYIIGRVLGHGGFAITYLAWDELLNTRAAIKEYMPYGIATRILGKATVTSLKTQEKQNYYTYGLNKFLEEAQTLARFEDHPGIVSVRDIFRANGTAYLVMQYLEGATFKDYLAEQGGRIPYQTAMNIMMPVMDALKEVHAAGLLHRDISPDNIFITRNGQVKVLDFGAARYALGEHSKSLSVVYKAGYAPEEQYRSKGKQGEYTDVYGVAATLYRAITGHVPLEALDRMAEDTLQSPTTLGVKISSSADMALMKALSVYAADRYQNITEFQQALLLEGAQPPTESVPADEKVLGGNEKNRILYCIFWFGGLFALLGVSTLVIGAYICNLIGNLSDQELIDSTAGIALGSILSVRLYTYSKRIVRKHKVSTGKLLPMDQDIVKGKKIVAYILLFASVTSFLLAIYMYAADEHWTWVFLFSVIPIPYILSASFILYRIRTNNRIEAN